MEKHPGGRPRSIPTQVVRVPLPLVPVVEELIKVFKSEPTDVEMLTEMFRKIASAFIEKNKLK